MNAARTLIISVEMIMSRPYRLVTHFISYQQTKIKMEIKWHSLSIQKIYTLQDRQVFMMLGLKNGQEEKKQIQGNNGSGILIIAVLRVSVFQVQIFLKDSTVI